MLDHPWQVILLPGGVMPAGPAYAPLLAELGREVDARPKELEVYAREAPPRDCSLATEVAGITRIAEAVHVERHPAFVDVPLAGR